MDTILNDRDWQEAFGVAGQVFPEAIITGGVSTEEFGINDVEEVIATDIQHGDYAETDVMGVFKLRDGRYLFLTGWCDTTGWDCQGGADAIVARSLEELIRFGLGDNARERLKLYNENVI